LAAQLIKYFPDYGQGLVNIVKPLFLQVNVEINIENITNSLVQGVVINNLYTHYPKQALDIVLRQALAALPKPPKNPILILIDSLDEAVTYSNENNLVTLFSNVDDLPQWVRFILTSRLDEQRVLSYFKTLKPYHYHLNEHSKENKSDINQYVEQRMLSERIQKQIHKSDVNSSALINQITELAQGNFLYTKVLLDDIESGGQPIDNLAVLPKSLNELYYNFLLRLKDEWEDKYQFIFKILTVTKAPVTKEELANLLSEKLSEIELRQSLGVVQQFLDVVKNQYAEETYSLFHQSLQEYLLDNKKSEVFYCSSRDGHRLIIDYYWQYHPHDWQECDCYGLQYLAIHLEDMAVLEKPPIKARKYIEKLHQLLATEVEGRNVWYDAKNLKSYTLGFLADVERAWRIAEKEFITSQSIVLQCRYALIISSIKSLVEDISTKLIIELLNKDADKGLDYFKIKMSNQQLKENDLFILTTLQPHELQPELVEKLFESINGLSDYNYQILIKSALVHLLPALLPDILKAAQNIKDEKVCVQALTLLIPKLRSLPDKYSDLIHVVDKIDKEEDKKNLLSLLASYILDENLPEILKKSKEFEQQYLADIMIALAPRLNIQLLEIALDIVLNNFSSNQNEYALTRAFCGLVSAPTLTEKVIKTIHENTQVFQHNNLRLYIMIALMSYLSLEQRKFVLQQIQEMDNLDLDDIRFYLPQSLLCKALESVCVIHDNSYKFAIQFLETCIEPAEVLQKENQKVIFFDDSYSDLPLKTPPEQKQKFEEEINYNTINDIGYRIESIGCFLYDLPNNQHSEILERLKLLEEVQTINDQEPKYLALSKLANVPNLSVNLANKILQEAQGFQRHDFRIQIISKLVEYLSEPLLQDVVVQTRSIANSDERTKALSVLSLKLSQTQLRRELQDLLATDDNYCIVDILETLTLQLPLEKLLEQLDYITQYLEVIKESRKPIVLTNLARRLPLEQLEYILQQLRTINNDYIDEKLEVLCELAPRLLSNSTLSDSLYNQLHNQYRDEVLATLSSRLEIILNQPYEILQNLQKYNDENSENFKALVLRVLPPLFSLHEFQEIVNIAKAIRNEDVRADTLIAIVPQLVKLPSKDLYKLWTEDIIHIIARRERTYLLLGLQKLKPIISVLCNQKSGETEKEKAIVKIIHAIQDVGKQWP
jgi:hypothetical protein